MLSCAAYFLYSKQDARISFLPPVKGGGNIMVTWEALFTFVSMITGIITGTATVIAVIVQFTNKKK